jgi:hypothetical protein
MDGHDKGIDRVHTQAFVIETGSLLHGAIQKDTVLLAGSFKSRDEKRYLAFRASLLLDSFFCHNYRII